MKRYLSAIFVFFCTLSSTSHGAAFKPVHVTAETGSVGNGAQFRVASGCVVLTAYHVVRNSTRADITPALTGENSATPGARDIQLDIALLSQQVASHQNCPVLPKPDAVSNTIDSFQNGSLVYVEKDGTRNNIPVYLSKFNSKEVHLKIYPLPNDPNPPTFRKGMSGSVVVFNGLPVAILQKVKTDGTGVAVATRIDEILRSFKTDLPLPGEVKKQVAVKKHKPFDLSILPKKYRRIVRNARKNKEKAIAVCERAKRTQQRAEDAAAFARKNPIGTTYDGHSRFRASNGNYYAGQVKLVGTTSSSHGFGVSIVGKGINEGDEYYCEFERNKGCQGPGLRVFAVNEGNHSKLDTWCGDFYKDRRRGFGYLTWNDESQREGWYRHGDEPKEGVWQTKHGRYEGFIKNTWHGEGVYWDANGQLRALGEWKNNNMVRNDTPAWRAGTLK